MTRRTGSGRGRAGIVAVLVGTAMTFGLAACGGGGGSATTAGSTVAAGSTTAPQVFQMINPQIQAAIAQAEPKLGHPSTPGEYDAIAATMRQALARWQATVLPASQEVTNLTEALEAMATDFSAPTVVVSKASSDIGAYMAAATLYEQAQHVASS